MQCRICHKEISDTPFCPHCGASQAPVSKCKRTRGNGQGTVYKLSNGKWRAEVTLGWDDKKRIVKTKSGFIKKKDALAAILELRQSPIQIDMDIQFKELYANWSKSHFNTISKDTEYCYTAAYAQCKSLYYKPFTQLKAKDLQEVVDNCPLGRRTKQNIKALLTCMYQYAIQNDYCVTNYASFIKLPPKEKSSKDAFTADERKLFWQDYESGNTFTGYILSMIYLGTRYGEISTIIKDNVHLKERYIIGGIKTNAGTDRIMPICDKIYPVIEKLYIAAKDKLLEMHEKTFYALYYETLRRIGIRKLSPHACRHTCATALAEAGVQPAIIQAILGHEDYSTTLQYTHLPLADLLKGINSIE